MMGIGWLWLYASAFLMLLELALPGFVIFFFGLSAATVGVIRLLVGGAFTPTWQLAAFSAFSILYLVVLRRWMKNTFFGAKEDADTGFEDGNVGRVASVTVAIVPPQSGRVLIGDAEWTATAETPLAAGTNARVISQHNLTVKVEALEK